MNKPEMKLEGDVLKISAAQDYALDGDKDGVAAVKASASLSLEIDGSEVLKELLKNSSLAQKAHDILKGLGLIKE